MELTVQWMRDNWNTLTPADKEALKIAGQYTKRLVYQVDMDGDGPYHVGYLKMYCNDLFRVNETEFWEIIKTYPAVEINFKPGWNKRVLEFALTEFPEIAQDVITIYGEIPEIGDINILQLNNLSVSKPN